MHFTNLIKIEIGIEMENPGEVASPGFSISIKIHHRYRFRVFSCHMIFAPNFLNELTKHWM